jgi:hypothetical protein
VHRLKPFVDVLRLPDVVRYRSVIVRLATGDRVMPPLIIDTDTILSTSQTFEGIHIRAGAALIFDPKKTIVVESHGNVVVEGILRMRPLQAATVHTLRFAGTRETDFVGGHTHVPLESDRGVWVFGAGQLV